LESLVTRIHNSIIVHSHKHTCSQGEKGAEKVNPFLRLLVVRLIYDTQAASPEIKKVKSPSKVEKWKKGAAKWRGKKGNKRAKGSAGEIKALKSLTAKRIVPQSHTDTHAHTHSHARTSKRATSLAPYVA